MALPLDGPAQAGQGQSGQYVYWVVMSHPTDDNVRVHSVRKPGDFDRDSFRVELLQAFDFCNIEILETMCFMEPHANSLPHMNLLVRARRPFRWKKVAERLLSHHRIHVSFGNNVRTWAQGVVYGCVASEHKQPEELDRSFKQWAKNGDPTPHEQFLPERWRQDGFVRRTQLTGLQFFDLCKEHNLSTEEALWAKAETLSESGDRGLLAFLLDNDYQTYLGKVRKAVQAKEKLRRASLSRTQLLEEYVAQNTCSCESPGFCLSLMKEILHANGLDGLFQYEVYSALEKGRAKKRNICLVGDADCGKSFLLKGLLDVFVTYTRPEGGSHQLEDLLEAEIVFLNDFEYDSTAPSWMPWSYFKDFLEGSKVKVAIPKNKGGGNQMFKGTAPVFLTCAQEVVLKKDGKEVEKETTQMQKRIKYLHLPHAIPEDKRKEVLRVCGQCSAKLFLEGKTRPATLTPAASPGYCAQRAQPEAKRQRTAVSCLRELQDLKDLLDCGVLSQEEFARLKTKLLQDV